MNSEEVVACIGADIEIDDGPGVRPDRARVICQLPNEFGSVSDFFLVYRFGDGRIQRVNAEVITRASMITPVKDQPPPIPIPMHLWCPECGARHIDRGIFETKPHHTHSCQSCGMTWRPAVVPTVGVQFLPGFRDTDPR